jgi:glycine/D-amino acid oxidase-like deaminating enzyme
VNVSSDRVIRSVAGLRPYRPAGFVLRTDVLDGKPIVHNYGHGGGGITLSWGTAHLAMEEAARTEHRSCAVVGCGAVGLATARLLQRHGWGVRIYARDLPPRTTSNIAGGQWSPYSVFEPLNATPAFRAQFQRASRLSHRYYQDLVGTYYGVRWIDNYFLDDEPVPAPTFYEGMSDLFPNVAEFGPGQHPFPRRYARRVTTMMVEPPIYLAAMERDFRLAGGEIVVREFDDTEHIVSLPEPLVINCSGLGASTLFDDSDLVPVKGQLTVLLPQPEVDYICSPGGGLYMMPRGDGIILGGTWERGVWDLEPNPRASERILTGHAAFFAEMEAGPGPWHSGSGGPQKSK